MYFKAKRILVPMDFSDVSRRALSVALQIASDQGAELDLMLVEPGVDKDLYVGEDAPIRRKEAEATMGQRAEGLRAAVDAAREEIEKDGRSLQAVEVFTHVSGGQLHDSILALAEERSTDLIVTGTHGPKGLKGALLGTRSEALVAAALCSVLVVKPEGYPYLRD